MRGSPFVRTLLVLVTLIVAGFGLSVLGSKGSTEKEPRSDSSSSPEGDLKSVATPFFLTLSAPAKTVTLESLGQSYDFAPSSQTLSGSLPIELGHPTLFIDIVWTDSNPSPRFAKLVLEPAGFPTQTKIFDATGDLSDVWELHLHHDEHE